MGTQELQVIEFEIKKLVPAQIDSNIAELQKFMIAVKEKYDGWIVTDSEIKTAMEERTKLNKLEKTISEERKRIQKEANANIEQLIEKLKKAEKETKTLSNQIGEQIKAFEEQEWENKQEEISEIIDNTFREMPELKLYLSKNDKWRNKTATLKKIETEIEEQYSSIKKKYDFINAQLSAVNEEIENKLDFHSVQFLMTAEYDDIMKKLVDKKNEIKITEENIKRRAEEEKQRALEEAERRKKAEIEALERQKEQEKEEAVEKAKNETVKEEKTVNTSNSGKKDTYICIKVNELTKEATDDLLVVIKKHNLKYLKKYKGDKIDG